MDRDRPFWLPASNYYVLAFAVSGGFFFIVWGLLRDSGDDMPWITAGLGATIVLAGSVVAREFILRRESTRLIQKRGMARVMEVHRTGKLTIEGNAAILREIMQKSEAANILSRFSAGHREVFELCAEYMARNENELKNLSASSPRLAPLLRGRTTAADLHRYHLLKWAEIEAHNLTGEANATRDANARIGAAQSALYVLDSALASYPAERTLLESRAVVEGLVVSITVAEMVSHAERLAFDGRYGEAIAQYRDALEALGEAGIGGPERASAAARINAEIDKLRALEAGV